MWWVFSIIVIPFEINRFVFHAGANVRSRNQRSESAENPAQRVKTVALSQYYGSKGPADDLLDTRRSLPVRGPHLPTTKNHPEPRAVRLRDGPDGERDVKGLQENARVLAGFRWLIQKYLKDPKGYRTAITSPNVTLIV